MKKYAKATKSHIVDEATRREEQVLRKGSFKNFFGMYKGVKIPWIMYALGVGYTIFAAFIMSSQLDSSVKVMSGDFSNLSVILVWVGLHFAYYFCSIGSLIQEFANFNLVNRVSGRLWDKILHLPLSYYDRESPDRLVSRITNDTDIAIQPFSIAIGLSDIVSSSIFVLGSMGSLNRTMTLWYVVCNLVIVVYALLVAKLYRKIGLMINNRLSKFTAFLSERLSNFRLIKASGSEEEELEEGLRLIDLRFQAAVQNRLLFTLNSMTNTLCQCVVIVVAFGIGGVMLSQGLVTDGESLYMFYIYGSSLALSIYMLLASVMDVTNMLGRGERFAAVFKEESEDIDTGSHIDVEDQDLVMDKVSFRYDENTPVLEDVSCTIPCGKVTAIVGENGSGKSTMAKLLGRLYPAADGTLRFGSTDVSTVSLKDWRNMFGMVTQRASLFSGTVRENICYGIDRAVTEEEIAKVIALAHIKDLTAALPDGVDSDVGPSGSNLSGGEQQRVAIARAMMKNPEYLILDEATANLDAKTEAAIKAGLEELMHGRTTIMIAHNISAIRNADHIIVLQDGRMLGEGTHEELMERCSYYKKFVTIQESEELLS